MVKKAHFYIFGGILTLLLSVTTAVSDQTPSLLKERLIVENAYIPNYRDLMREMIITLSSFAKKYRPDFHLVVQNGQELLTRGQWENDLDDLHRAEMKKAGNENGKPPLHLFVAHPPVPTGTVMTEYINAIDGLMIDHLICSGASGKLFRSTEKSVKGRKLSLIEIKQCLNDSGQQKTSPVLEEKQTSAYFDMDPAQKFNAVLATTIPYAENSENIISLQKVKNGLFITDTTLFTNKDSWLKTLSDTNFDLLIIDPFFKSNIPLTAEEIRKLKTKKTGAVRLVFAVLNVGGAEKTRLYFEKKWESSPPEWLRFPSDTHPDTITVDYWNDNWQRIVGIYFKSIMDLGFDGIILTGVDTYKTYENLIPIN